jgi:hypothetical protein
MARQAYQLAESARERRALPRKPMAVSARLELPSGGRSVQIVDLSDRGARVQLAAPPPVGAPALLKWQSHECYGTVAWATDSECGLRFDQELAQTVLATCAESHTERLKPVAALDRIRIGAKRREKSFALAQPEPADNTGFAWTIALRRPIGRGGLSREALSPAEEMFFYLAPLAHVVTYEDELKRRRRNVL